MDQSPSLVAHRVASALAGGWLVAACSAGGCTSSDGSARAAPVDAGAEASLGPVVRDPGVTPRGIADAQAGDASSAGVLPAVATPAGWVPYPSFDATCSLFTPASPAALPPPVQWEACNGSLPASAVCRQMSLSWAKAQNGLRRLDPSASAWVGSNGGVVLQLSRYSDAVIYRMIADADGPVRSTILELPSSSDCTLGAVRSLNEGKIVYTAEQAGHIRYAAIGGGIDDLIPRTYRSYSDGVSRQFVAGAMALLEWSPALSLVSWTDASQLGSIGLSGSDATLQAHEFQFLGSALFFTLSSSGYSKIMVYSPASGPLDLVSPGNDPTTAMADLGTDGHDLVWAAASNLNASDASDISINWVTAPFATSASTVHSRRLRAERPPFYFGTASFDVGCGYAVNYAFGPSPVRGVRVVRLSDGQSWPLMTSNDADPWHWVRPLAVTCTEVFVSIVDPSGDNNVARVRLDSLGPGEPSN